MSIKLRTKDTGKGKSLYLDIYHNKKRQYEFLEMYLTGNKANDKEVLRVAETIRAKREIELYSNDNGIIPKHKRQMNFVDYFKSIADKKPKSEKAWRNTLKLLTEYTKGSIPIGAINESWLEELKGFLVTRVSNNTAHTYFSKIKAALRKAMQDKIIVTNPGENVSQIKKTETERTFLTEDELQRLAATKCKDNEVKRAFLFSCFTGLRLSDIENLQWSNIQDGKLYFRQQKTKGLNYLPLSETAKRLLDSEVKHIDKVFNLPSRSMIQNVLNKWVDDAGIDKKVSFHTARHSFATLSLNQGTDLYTVSKMLGHKNIQATQIYAKVLDKSVNQAMSSLPQISINF